MTSALAHRGPDGQGTFVDGPVGLGHRRLSIIDLEGGRQPMPNEDRTVWATYNGEIYNYRQLTSELESLGHQFRTQSDTEVIVHAWEQWGEQCVTRFRGMFAFAVYDSRQRLVFLARDRLGIKPLVYSVEPNRVLFASELLAFRALPDFRPSLDRWAIDQFLQWQYVPAPNTVYEGVRKLPPGCTLTIPLDGVPGKPMEYWNVRFDVDESRSENEWAEELDATIREAVKIRLCSDVPFGAFLSGGIDSSLVVGYMAELLDRPVKTFSIGFPEVKYNELSYAEIVARHNNTDHHTEVIRPRALDLLPSLVRHFGEPFGDPSAIPTYCVSQLAAQHVKMVLSGDGGDECFAGYSRYGKSLRSRSPHGSMRRRLRHTAGQLLRQFGLRPARPLPVIEWTQRMSIFDAAERAALWDVPVDSSAVVPDWVARQYDTARSWDSCSWMQYLDLRNYLPGAVLTKVDIASMYHGLEVRVPLLDHHVVEAAAQIPVRHNLQLNSDGSFRGKLILRRLASQFYERAIFDRPKQGFALPIRHWFQGGDQAAIADLLSNRESPLADLFSAAALKILVNRHLASPPGAWRIWLLLILDEFLRQHRDYRTSTTDTTCMPILCGPKTGTPSTPTRRPLRVALLTTEYPTESTFAGGVASNMKRTAVALRARGHDVEVFTLSRESQMCEVDDGILVHRVPALWNWEHAIGRTRLMRRWHGAAKVLSRSWSLHCALRRRHREAGFDVVQAVSSHAIGYFSSRYKLAPLVTFVNGYKPAVRRVEGTIATRKQLQIERAAFAQMRRSNAVHVPSDLVADLLRRHEGIHAEVVEYAYDLSSLQNKVWSPPNELPSESFGLFFGALSRLKGCDRLARVLPRVLSKNPDMTFFFIGRSQRIDGMPAVRWIRSQLAGYSDRVHVMTALPPDELFRYVAHSRFVVLPSRTDNLPNTCIEAMALGRVVVASRDASFEQVIDHDRNGLLVRQDDDNELAQQLDRAWNMNFMSRQTMGLAARHTVDRFRAENALHRLEAIFERVVSGESKAITGRT